MNRMVRGILEMARRVSDFCRRHPSPDANFASVAGRLDEGIAELDSLAQEQDVGVAEEHSAAAHRRGLRRRVQQELLPHLVSVAEDAAEEQPALVDRFRPPASNAPNETVRIRARQLLEAGRAERELLTRHGLAAQLLDDLAAVLDEIDASAEKSAAARRDHVGASLRLDAATKEVARLVELLDHLNRYRFSEDEKLLGAWESTRRVLPGASGSDGASGSEGASAEAGPPAAGTGGEAVKPAA